MQAPALRRRPVSNSTGRSSLRVFRPPGHTIGPCRPGAHRTGVVAQRIDVGKTSHADVHALPYLPADISFGDVSAAGMGCDRSIAFVTRVFAQASPDPLVWHSDGLVPGRYDWKCWMDECHYGTLVADGPAQQVPIDSDPLDSVTAVPAGTPVELVFTGARMMCWRTIFFTTAGDITKTRAYPTR